MRSVKIAALLLPLVAITADARSYPSESPPGVGVICALGIYNAIAEVGRQCFADQDTEFKFGLAQALVRLDDYVLRNSKFTADDLARFKREQSGVGRPKELVCTEEMIGMYRATMNAGSDKLRGHIDALVARPGKPTWGDCL